MPSLVRFSLSESASILLEASADTSEFQKYGAGEKIIEKLETRFDKLVSSAIFAGCTSLIAGFQNLKKQSIPPTKAIAEFGMQFNAEGNIYLVKIAASATIKITIEWTL
jgi:hypothetical protein